MTPIINVAEHLSRMAAEQPATAALHLPLGAGYRTLNFAELNDLSTSLAFGLNELGIKRGTRTVLMVPPSAEFFALTFALFKVAAVPVLIDPGMGVKNLGPCLATAEPEAFIGIAKAHLARRLFGWGARTIRTTVNVGNWRFFCSKSSDDLIFGNQHHDEFDSPEVNRDDLAAILFTSGSTGPAKGVEYTHGLFASQVEMLKQTYGIQSGEIDFCTFPLFALFGPALGMTCVVPEMDASRPATIDAGKAVNHINQYGVTNLFGSPAVIRRLAEYDKPLPTVRRAISAGAPASLSVVERFANLLPNGVELFTPYGATECLPVANIGSRELLETRALTEQGKGVCIGRPVAWIRVDVIRITDEPIATWDNSLLVPTGEVGELVVRGPVVTKRYYGNPEATRRAKIIDPASGETLHRMGDVGYKDDSGRLWFCGRKSHRVVTPNGTLFTDMVEPVFNTIAGIKRTALIGLKRNGETIPVLLYELDLERNVIPPADKRTTFEYWSARLTDHARLRPEMSEIGTFLFHPDFPVDVRHNSKIFREKLAVWADKRLGPKWNGGLA